MDLIRYSGRQERGLDLHGVVGVIGVLGLSDGVGDLWPLISAGLWLNAGKGTPVGMGHYVVEPLAGGAT
jgi:hypothetical protein